MSRQEKKLRLGTRRSLLAWAQSGWVARELERLNPGWTVELHGIETRGDRILDVSLQSVEGKEFFVAELDAALKSGEVDLTVHSMKDLSLDRPAEFVLGAAPRRENPRDVILFGPHVMEKIRAGKTLKIGTSSPRRLENIPGFLVRALPQIAPGDGKPSVEFVDIRGNVNTRLSRVHEPADSPRYLDGVVLAFAGLIRLWADEPGRKELEKLLEGVRPIVLPLRECPAAPAQGALAVECRADDAEVREIAGKLHHAPTAAAVEKERALLAAWGGGCHQKFGATAVEVEGLDTLLYIRGLKPDGEFVDELRWKMPAPPQGEVIAWEGGEHRGATAAEDSADVSSIEEWSVRPMLIAHSRAVRKSWAEALKNSRLWTSGTASWFRLAAMGLWVEGSSEGFGFTHLEPTIRQGLLGLPPFDQWVVLTHEAGVGSWEKAKVVPTYRVSPHYSEGAREALKQATHIYWTSGSQFDQLRDLARPGATHSCGPGKTAQHLKKAGIKPVIFPSAEEWKEWIGTRQA